MFIIVCFYPGWSQQDVLIVSEEKWMLSGYSSFDSLVFFFVFVFFNIQIKMR